MNNIWRKTQIGVLKVKICKKCLILFEIVFKLFCVFFALKFESLGPLFKKLTYKDITNSGPFTRLLIDLKTSIKKLSVGWVFWLDKQPHCHQINCLIAITRFSITFSTYRSWRYPVSLNSVKLFKTNPY